MESPLFSVVVLVYRHYEYLQTALDSVFEQNYDNIELIVSDDGSPNFPVEEIQNYIDQNKGKNIRSVIIRTEPQNVGTVKHLNHVKTCCNGQYIVFLAGDDALYNSATLTHYHHGFLNAPENCYIEMAQTAMFDNKLDKIQSYYMTDMVRDALIETAESTDALKTLLARFGACLPTTSTCFKREFFNHFGNFDESYKLVEDFPMHCRLANENYIIHYVNHVTIKHRDGGISHGQNDTLPISAKMYYADLLKMDQKIIIPLLKVLPIKEQKKYKRKWLLDILWLKKILRHDKYATGPFSVVYKSICFIKKVVEWLIIQRHRFLTLATLLFITSGLIDKLMMRNGCVLIGEKLTVISWIFAGCFMILSAIRWCKVMKRKFKEFLLS